MGKKSGKRTTMRCRRCGGTSYHKIKHKCPGCGYGESAKLKNFSWKNKKK